MFQLVSEWLRRARPTGLGQLSADPLDNELQRQFDDDRRRRFTTGRPSWLATRFPLPVRQLPSDAASGPGGGGGPPIPPHGEPEDTTDVTQGGPFVPPPPPPPRDPDFPAVDVNDNAPPIVYPPPPPPGDPEFPAVDVNDNAPPIVYPPPPPPPPTDPGFIPENVDFHAPPVHTGPAVVRSGASADAGVVTPGGVIVVPGPGGGIVVPAVDLDFGGGASASPRVVEQNVTSRPRYFDDYFGSTKMSEEWTQTKGTWGQGFGEMACSAGVGAGEVRGQLTYNRFIGYTNCSVECVLPAPTANFQGVFIRGKNTGADFEGYVAAVNNAGLIRLFRFSPGETILIASAGFIAGSVLRLTAVGTTFALYQDTTLVGNAVDVTFPIGACGLCVQLPVSGLNRFARFHCYPLP